MQLTENTPEQWSSVIADLTTKQQSAREHAEQLQKDKSELALEAAMGGESAKKRLDKVNTELARLALEGADWDVAIQQARQGLASAHEAEANAIEQARRAELQALASTALGHAEEFSSSLQRATAAGAQLKITIRNMMERANPGERLHLDQLLQPGPYMRAAEHAELRAHLEFISYPGPRAHLMAMKDALKVHMGSWIKPG